MIDVVFYLSVGALFFLALATAANDTGAALATVFGSGTLAIGRGVIFATVVGVVVAALVGVPVLADLAPALIPSGEGGLDQDLLGALYGALLAAAIVMMLATGFGLPVAALPVFAGALAAAMLTAGIGDGLEFLLITLLAAFGLPLVTALVGWLAYLILRRRVFDYYRPRDRLRWLLPSATGLTVALGLGAVTVLAPTAGVAALPIWAQPWLAVPVIGLVGFLVAFVLVNQQLTKDPFWVGNDVAGANSAFRRLEVLGSVMLAVPVVAWQAVNLAAPVALIGAWFAGGSAGDLGLPGADGDWKRDLIILIPTILAIGLGVFLLGHKTALTLGRDLAPLPAARGVAVNLAQMIGVIVVAATAMPLTAVHGMAGALVGSALAEKGGGGLKTRVWVKILVTWVFAPVVAALIAAVVVLIIGMLAPGELP